MGAKFNKKKILELRKEGRTYQNIADVVGCTRQYVAQICGKENLNQPIKVNYSAVLPKKVKRIDPEPIIAYLEMNIKLQESNKHFYEVFDRRGARYPLENIYKEMLDVVRLLAEVTE